MKDKSPSGSTGMKGRNMNMLKGLTRKSPPGVDSSMKPMTKRSVDEDAMRSGVAPTPRTLGPRDA